MITGIYAISHRDTNKIYIGSAINIEKRWSEHKWALKNNRHHSIHLQRAVNKYGLQSFNFTVIEIVQDRNSLIEREQFFMDIYKSSNPLNGYNIYPIAGSSFGCIKGPRPDYVKKKLSAANLGKKHTPEQNLKQSLAQFGKKRKPFSLETRLKMSKPKSFEARLNMSIAAKIAAPLREQRKRESGYYRE